MKVSPTPLEGLLKIELKVFGDQRGFFTERYNEARYKENGLPTYFAQDNHSRSAPGVLRGLHFQFGPPQGKLVGVTRGRIWDVAVDIRVGSPTYGKHFACELSDMNGTLLWIPRGFAHGFCVLGDESADVIYKVDNLYNPQNENGFMWNDPSLGIPWPIQSPTISARDQKLQSFGDYTRNPIDWNQV